ncbi:MAG: hypothetical protein LBE31_00165 [Deltaproteobacteria bacterium]|jgi:hypothetical protein|nr:hypothetical protein [Deltaproteobacteria bacterium]
MIKPKERSNIMAYSVDYEVALEVLGQYMQPFVQAEYDEGKKESPNQAFLNYCRTRIRALGDLQDELHTTDTELIAKIIDPKNSKFFGAV